MFRVSNAKNVQNMLKYTKYVSFNTMTVVYWPVHILSVIFFDDIFQFTDFS